jgi:hypothetical protein
MLLLKLFPLKDWLLAALVAASIGLIACGICHERDIGRVEGRAEIQSKWDAAVKRDLAEKATEIQRVAVAQKETDHEAEKFQFLADAGAVRAVDAGQRVQQRFASIGVSVVSSAISASAPGASANSPDVVRADVFGRCVATIRQLASFADNSRGAGLDAEGHYDALRP